MKKKISIHDIAKQLNVSAATVSFVLNGKAAEKRISNSLEKKILNYVKQSEYRPNRIAKSLRTGKSKIIAMLVESISDPFFSTIARIVEESAYRLDYKIFYASTENDTKITKELIRVFRDAQVDGYIIAPPPGIEDDIRSLMEDNLPVIFFDRYFPGLETYNVVVDNFGGTYEAMRHFLENGYTNIGFVTLVSAQTQMDDRLNGYVQALTENSLTHYIQKIAFEEKQDQEKMVANIRAFLEANPQLEAVLFATNYLAISGLEAIRILKLAIPGDIAVIGFDDNTHFALFSPAITAVAQPVREMSEHVINQLMASLVSREKMQEKKTIVLPTKLMIRESSLPAADIESTGDVSLVRLTNGHNTKNKKLLKK